MDFEELYHTHKRTVFNLALQYVQVYEDAQEITQDVFVSVYQSIHILDIIYTSDIQRIVVLIFSVLEAILQC